MAVNISPKIWGPKTWKSIHYMAFAYPEQPTDEQKQAASNLLYSLQYLLPCEKCRNHYAAYIAQNPPQVNSRAEFTQYINTLHNHVNGTLGKPVVPYDPSQPYSKAQSSGINWTQVLIAVVLGILVGLLISRSRKRRE